jgi:hypothetical protein
VQQKRGDAAGLGGKLQPPAGREADSRDLAQDGGGCAAAQALLHRPQEIGLVARMGKDQAPGLEAKANEAGAMQIAGIESGARAQAPQHPTRVARQPRRQGRGKTIRRLTPHDLVQAAARQAAPGQGRVHRGCDGHRAVRGVFEAVGVFDGADSLAQGGQTRLERRQAGIRLVCR